MVATSSSTSGKPAKPKKPNFLSKIKQVFGNNNNLSVNGSNLTSQRSRRSSAASEANSFGVAATRTRSKSSFIFGNRDKHQEEKNAEAALEERRSKCMAIKLAKRDPPAVQRLLVDCEFCNPPPNFGKKINIHSPEYTSKDVKKQLQKMEELPGPLNSENEAEWNPGLKEWLEMRRKWLTPTQEAQPVHHLESELTPDRYYTVYDKLIYQTRPFKHPLNLGDLVQILKAGWIGEGSWPEDPDAKVWSTDESEPESANGMENSVYSDAKGSSEAKPSHNSTVNTPGTTNPSVSQRENTPGYNENQSGKVAQGVSGVSSPVPAIHVQFSDIPHPRDTNSPSATPSPPPAPSRSDLAPLSRVQSSYGMPLRPVVSSQSSVVSVTDSD